MSRKTYRTAGLVFTCALLLTTTASTRQAETKTAANLADLFKPGAALQDRNGDGFIDFVDARIVLGDSPGAAEIAAASDIAARLGFETSAMDLPMANGPGASALTLVVGAAALAKAGLPAGPTLAAGEGLARLSDEGGRRSLVLLGGDGAGLAVAAGYVAGRLPYVWDPKGATLDKAAEEMKKFLTDRGIAADGVRVTSVLVKSGGVERLTIAAAASSDAVRKATSALTPRRTSPRAAAAPVTGPAIAGVRLLRLELSAPGAAPTGFDLTPAVVESRAPEGPLPRRPGAAAKENLDLSSLYGNDGLLGDSDNNLIPDRVDALVSPDGGGIQPTIDLAARLGLESTGVSIPLVRPADAIAKPESEPTMVLIGRTHPLVKKLVDEKKLDVSGLQAGEGLIAIVRRAFGEKSAVVITGADDRGTARAVHQVAERFPHIWARGKDRPTLDDVEDDVRRLIAGRSPAGQAATALYKLDQIAKDLAGKDLERASVKVFVERAADGFVDVVRRDAAQKIKAGAIDVSVQSLDVRAGRSLIDDRFDVPSEVDEWRQLFQSRVLPEIRKNKPVSIEVRLSEPPEIRAALAQEIRAALAKKGVRETDATVAVLSAYKQGYSWLYDVVRPALTGKPVAAIRIRFAELGPPPEFKQQGTYVPARWLLEAYPIDEILARELKVDLTKITFEMAPIGSPAYEVVATDAGGAELLRRTFEPALVLRPFFDQFPNYEKTRVTTGWMKAVADGRTLVDQRIETDTERFWDHFQAKTLPALYDHVMALGEGKPRAEDAPFFGELKVDLTLSEPDYQIGLDQEQISSLEAIHEELYFNTLHFFDVMGRYTRGTGLSYPGRVIPVMHPKADGKPGQARITVTGFDAPRPQVVVEYTPRGGRPATMKLDVPKVAVERPAALAAVVRDGRDGIERLAVRIKVDTKTDERRDLIKRASVERVDRTIMSAEQATAVLANLNRLRAAGLYADALAYPDLGEIAVAAAWEHRVDPLTQTVARLEANGRPRPLPDPSKLVPSGYKYAGGPIVQWDTPIPPPEAYELLAKMSASFPEARMYKVGESYLGKDVWAMDVMSPIAASHWSQAKQTTIKPTVVYSARQHANEVSSTSHTLKLAELMLTDPAFKEKLKKVNAVFHPITNPDGAQLAYDLYRITPHYMLHAGYLGSLGVDVTSNQSEADPMYPETKVRPLLWRTWLPDIFLNPHGYPSHEWVQIFSEYAAWVRTRAVETREYWSMRGWWMPGFAYLDDPKYPRHKEEQFKLRSMITSAINRTPEVKALNDRAYARYKRYTFDFDQKNFKLDFTDNVLIYSSIKGAKASPTSQDFMTRNPNVTIWEGVTEAPDETAQGDWLKLVATAGLTWDKAILEYLVLGSHQIERKTDEFFGGTSMSINRPRPPKKPGEPKETTATQERP